MWKGRRGRRKPYNQRQAAIKNGWRSGLEERVGDQLDKMEVEFQFETIKIKYEQPAKARTYTPDFILPNGILVETKGLFSVEDRKKHLWIKEQHPELEIRFTFSNPNTKLRKGSHTTYAMWCDKFGFLYSDKSIPKSWIEEEDKNLPYDSDFIIIKE